MRTRCLRLALTAALAVACDDAATSVPPPVDAAGQVRDLEPAPDGPRDAAPPDAVPADAAAADLPLLPLDGGMDAAPPPDVAPPTPDADPCPSVAIADEGGQASAGPGQVDIHTEGTGLWWRVQVIDPRGRPLAGAAASVITSADAFTMVVHAPGHLAAVLNAPLVAGAYGVNAARQATEGPGTKDVLELGEVPACTAGALYVSVLAALAPLPPRVVREIAGEALADACASGAEPPQSPACAALDEVTTALSGLPARLRLAADSHPEYGEVGLTRMAGAASAGLLQDTCGTPWGVAPLAWVDDSAPRERWGRLAEVWTRRAAALQPGDADGAERLRRFGVALGQLAGPASALSFDLVAEGAELAEVNSLTQAAGAVRALVAAGDAEVPPGLAEPLRTFVATGPAPLLDSFAYARSAQPAGAYGLGPAATCDLARAALFVDFQNSGVEIPAGAAVAAMLDVLEAAATAWEAPPEADGGLPPPLPDPDAGLPPPPDPDAGPVGPCGPDLQEPNQSWEQEVRDGERQPRNVAVLEHLTLEPGDVDWYDFEGGLINQHLSATLSADPWCESPGGRLCAELFWWTWVDAEGLNNVEPLSLVGRRCADIADGIVLDAGAVGGLAGEPWTSMVIQVTEDAAAPLAAPLPYRIRATR